MLPVLTTVIGGAAATCGFALGKMVAAGFVASVVGGLALLVMGAVLVAMRVSSRGRSHARGVAAVAGVLTLAVAATIGAGALSRG